MISQNGRRWRSKEALIAERNDAANKRFEKRLDSSQNVRERIEKAVSWQRKRWANCWKVRKSVLQMCSYLIEEWMRRMKESLSMRTSNGMIERRVRKVESNERFERENIETKANLRISWAYVKRCDGITASWDEVD